VEGIARLHEPVAKHGGDDLDRSEVLVSNETGRGPWVQTLLATGYPDTLNGAKYPQAAAHAWLIQTF